MSVVWGVGPAEDCPEDHRQDRLGYIPGFRHWFHKGKEQAWLVGSGHGLLVLLTPPHAIQPAFTFILNPTFSNTHET